MSYICSVGTCTECGEKTWVTPATDDTGNTLWLCYHCYKMYNGGII